MSFFKKIAIAEIQQSKLSGRFAKTLPPLKQKPVKGYLDTSLLTDFLVKPQPALHGNQEMLVCYSHGDFPFRFVVQDD